MIIMKNRKDKSSEVTKKTQEKPMSKYCTVILSIGLIVFILLTCNEYIVQPYKSKKVVDFARKLYQEQIDKIKNTYYGNERNTFAVSKTEEIEVTDLAENRDQKGRLLQFQQLLEVNEDVKGWISIPDTNIDYVVMQAAKNNRNYYLSRNLLKEMDKSGSIFLDEQSSVENNSKNIVIHGHNMASTNNMFHSLVSYKQLDYYKERPVISFDTIYQKSKWKIFAVLITNGSSKKEKLFDYTKSDFKDSSEFLNFVYQIRVRSLYNIDTVDVNESDQLLTLSTCSYELENYRTVIIARRIREGEDAAVEVTSVQINDDPLYPQSWYNYYGGKAPKVTNFEEALQDGKIGWYSSSITKNRKECNVRNTK